LTPPSPNEFGGSSAADDGVFISRGDYVTALGTFTISSVGIEADPLQGSLAFRVDIYATTGFVRGGLLATSSAALNDLGQTFYDVPINFTFLAGQDYDINISWPDGANVLVRFFGFDPAFYGSSPFDVGPVRVTDGEAGSCAECNSLMPNLRLQVVPEPSALSLLGLGFVVLSVFHRRTKQ
jgi:hypothetical protein